MRKNFSQRFIIVISAIVVIFGTGYFLIYPLAKDFFKKEKPAEVSNVEINRSIFKKLGELKDNTVSIDESQPIFRDNPFAPF